MAMTDEEFEAALGKLGIQSKAPYSSMSDASPNASYDTGLPQQDHSRFQQAYEAGNNKANEAVQSASGNMPEFPEPTPGPQSSQKPVGNQPPQEAPLEAPVDAPVVPPAPVERGKQLQENPLDNPEFSDDAIKSAQDNTDLRRLGMGLGESFGRFAATAGGGKFDDSMYRSMEKNADSNVQNIKDRREAVIKNLAAAQTVTDIATKNMDLQRQQRLNDPKSNESKGIREMVIKYEPRLANDESFNQMSGKDVKEFMLHFLETESRIESVRATKESSAIEKQEKRFNDRVTKFSEALDPNRARGGQMALSQQNFNRAENLQGLVNKVGAGFNLDPRETEDFAIGLARLLSGSGATSRSQVEALLPKTARGSANKALEWITNAPRGTEQQEFIKRMYSTVVREKEISRQQVKNAQHQRVAAFEDINAINSEIFEGVMYGYGISPEEYSDFKKKRKDGKQSGADLDKASQASADDPALKASKEDENKSKNKKVSPKNKQETITIRRKNVKGSEKTLTVENAKKYLNNADFEQVQ